MVKAISRVAKELAKRKKRSMDKFPKGKKGSKAVDARTSRYIKTPSGMKLNPDRFKQKPLPKTKRLVDSPTKKTLKDTARIGAAGAAGFAVGKIDSAKKAKAKENKKRTQTMAAKAVEKQKQRQKEYRQKKGGKGNR